MPKGPVRGREGTMTAFVDPRAPLRFWSLAGATFLSFTTVTATALLAVVLRLYGLADHEIGVVLAVYGAPVVLGNLLAGPVIARHGVATVIRFGLTIMLFAYLSFHLTAASFLGACLSRFLQGVGFGLFLPTAMVYAKAQLTPLRMTYYFGIFSAMVPLPNMIGPALADLYLAHGDPEYFFLVTAIPLCAGTLIAAAVVGEAKSTAETVVGRYADLLADRRLWMPFLGVFTVGSVFGFVSSFMALFLLSQGVAVLYFFSTFTVCFFGGRVLAVPFFERASKWAAVMTALILMCGGFLLLVAPGGTTPALAVAGGVVFGLGYTVAYPQLSVWVAEYFAPAARGRPISLFNAFFNAGIYLTPLWTGASMATIGLRGPILILCAASLCVAAMLGVYGRRFAVARAAAPGEGSGPGS